MTKQKQKAFKRDKGMLLAVGVLFLLSGIVVAGLTTKHLITGISAKNWPTTTAVIISSGTEWQRATSGDSPTLIAKVVYEYEVDGYLYHNNRISPNQYGSNKPSHAQREAAAYPVNNSVFVYYNPDDPAQSFLVPGVGWIYLIGLVVGTAVGLAGLFLLQQGRTYKSGTNQQLRHQVKAKQGSVSSRPVSFRRTIFILLPTVLLSLLVIFMFNKQEQQPNQLQEHFTTIIEEQPIPTSALRHSEAIVDTLKLYAVAQKKYKAAFGHYTTNLQELTIPYEPQPAASGFADATIHDYILHHIPLNGKSAMNYQEDFVICATPTDRQKTNNYSYAIGPKAIVIFSPNAVHGEVTNATQLQQWRAYR